MKKNVSLIIVLLMTSFNAKCAFFNVIKGVYSGAQDIASAQVFNRALGATKEALRITLSNKQVGAVVGLAGAGLLYSEYRNGIARNTDCRNVALGTGLIGVSIASVGEIRDPASMMMFTLGWGTLTALVTGGAAFFRALN